MRTLLSTIGSRGDVQPLAALATALREQGHDVRLCVPPDFVEWLTTLGFEAIPIGPPLRALTDGPSPADLTPERRRQLAEESVAAQFDTVRHAAQGCDVIVGATALQIAAPTIAEWMGVPYVFAAYCPQVVPSPALAPLLPSPLPDDATHPPDTAELWRRDSVRFSTLFGPALNAQRARLGLAPVDDVRSHVLTSRPWLAADATLAPWPVEGDSSVLQTGAWVLHDARPLPPALLDFLDAGEPPVYFGFGSMRAPSTLGEAMLAAARAMGRRAVIARGWAALDVAPSSDCIVVDEVNQQALFPRMTVVVHHGGAGTTTCAAAAGTPQVIAPQMYDQSYWARRVAELGVGAALPKGLPDTDALTRAVTHVLSSSTGQRARALAPRIRMDGAATATRHLMSVIDRETGR